MSLIVVIQFAVLAVMLAIAACILYAIFEMREVYADHRDKFLRAITAFEEFQKMQPQFISVLERIESNGHALQKIAVQVEVAAAALKTTARHSSSIETSS